MELDDAESVTKVKARAARRKAEEQVVLGDKSTEAAATQTDIHGDLGAIPARTKNRFVQLERVEDMERVRFHAHAGKIVKQTFGPRLKPHEGGAAAPRQHLALASKQRGAGGVVVKRTSVNCSLAVDHELFNISEYAEFVRARIKVDGQLQGDGDAVRVAVEGNEVVVTTTRGSQMKKKRVWSKKRFLSDAFSTRYVKYLTRKYICKIELKDFVRCVSTDHSKASIADPNKGSRFEIRYTNVHKDKHLKLKMARKYGTKLEAARREMLEEDFWELDRHKLSIKTRDQFMVRRVRATGERVGGEEYVTKHAITLEEERARLRHKLRHWVALQQRSYRAPLGGAMRGWVDKSVNRHDPDRVGKGGSAHSTAGYTAPRVLRSKTGTRLGLSSLLYTGTAPDGFKCVRKAAVAQRLGERYQKTHAGVHKTFSKAGDADRTIYNWKPKWLMSGKMDLHKRDWR